MFDDRVLCFIPIVCLIIIKNTNIYQRNFYTKYSFPASDEYGKKTSTCPLNKPPPTRQVMGSRPGRVTFINWCELPPCLARGHQAIIIGV